MTEHPFEIIMTQQRLATKSERAGHGHADDCPGCTNPSDWLEGSAEADTLDDALAAVKTMLTVDGVHADHVSIRLAPGWRYADGELLHEEGQNAAGN